MQFRPDAAELLADIAELLEDKVIDAVSGPLQHQVRVAANLARIVEREARLGESVRAAERSRLITLVPNVAGTSELIDQRAALCNRLMGPDTIGDEEMGSIYDALVATVRDDLAISKPGYDSWAGV
jgi:Domain of unknown function (DUF6285)